MSADSRPGRAETDRWRATAEALAEVRRDPGLTRVELARRLRLASGSATEIAGRLRELGWVAEERAPCGGRGRPTTRLVPAPDGPAVVAVDVRFEGWRAGLAGLDGVPVAVRSGRHARRDPDAVATELDTVVGDLVGAYPGPVVAAGIGVAATVIDEHLAQGAGQGWSPLDVRRIGSGHGLPVLVGNDANLAGVAEVRDGAAAGAGTALFLTVEVGVGGALLLRGRPQTGARGAAGEFGHLPFGDPSLGCACGARGCWNNGTDGRALARMLGEPEPDDPYGYSRHVLDRAADGEPGATSAVTSAAASLARGTAGLVNAHDPEVVVLAGLAPALRAAAPDAFAVAYEAGLMAFRRAEPPPVRDAAHGADGVLRGAAAIALDRATSARGLAARPG
ncbi:ROK family transcriptional regulator [Pseudonocardia parietis]|uniref:NBD/HSP70 family sugar kinase n=1 Tax=Pseudonocardia parietis TaxID=570936 RepID=A0ABS4W332_9PSEU|nr:ROK family transcriptional regulator [Pseudonocardia parietis]MBP2370617.1 putative NBD/HSP70 family sugar kinase [Pseudonocardia parietis]